MAIRAPDGANNNNNNNNNNNLSGDPEEGSEDTPPASGTEDCGPFKKVWSHQSHEYHFDDNIIGAIDIIIYFSTRLPLIIF